MGVLIYGSSSSRYEFDDRTLEHLKVAVVAKLRRHESFLLNWKVAEPPGVESGRISVWVSREIPLTFVFDGGRPPTLNGRWLEALMTTSLRTGGMELMPEVEADSRMQA